MATTTKAVIKIINTTAKAAVTPPTTPALNWFSIKE